MLADLYEQIDLKIKNERKKLPWSSKSEFKDELNKARQANFSIYRDPFAHYKTMNELAPVRLRIQRGTNPELFHMNERDLFQSAEHEILSNPPDMTLAGRGNRSADYNEGLELMKTMGEKRSLEYSLLAGFTHKHLVKSLSNYYKTHADTPPMVLDKQNKSTLVELAVETLGLNISDMAHHRDNDPPPTPTT